MPFPVLLSACRTPIGKFQGALSTLSAPQLGAVVIEECLERLPLEKSEIDDVIMGNVLGAGVGQAPARQAALQAGIPESVSALTINKMCGSGLQAVMLAAQAVKAEEAELVVAGGMESMSQAPFLIRRDMAKFGHQQLLDAMLFDGLQCSMTGQGMGMYAEAVAQDHQISREALDEFALESHQRAVATEESGLFQYEIAPVTVKSRRGETSIESDETPRAEATLQQLSGLRPAFTKEGVVTAGNSSSISDGAAAVVVASEQYAEQNEIQPMARILASATSGLAPKDLFVAPILAVQTAVAKAGLNLSEIDLFEINEAFASQMIACMNGLELEADRVNIYGGAIALGHPIGASGARTLVTLLNGLEQTQKRLGVVALCLGGGNAVAMVVERLE